MSGWSAMKLMVRSLSIFFCWFSYTAMHCTIPNVTQVWEQLMHFLVQSRTKAYWMEPQRHLHRIILFAWQVTITHVYRAIWHSIHNRNCYLQHNTHWIITFNFQSIFSILLAFNSVTMSLLYATIHHPLIQGRGRAFDLVTIYLTRNTDIWLTTTIRMHTNHPNFYSRPFKMYCQRHPLHLYHNIAKAQFSITN